MMSECIRSSLLMRWMLKRRRIVFIVLFIAIFFLIYQLLSLKELNVQMSDKLSHIRDQNELSGKHTEDIGAKEFPQIEPNLIRPKSGPNKSVQVFGVLSKYVSLYESTGDTFRCILSGEAIPSDQINDDYCDCADGSDEPSTNACPHNRFYCRTNRGLRDDYISSAKVNDGICDCCDGTDEYRGLSTPLRLTRSQMETIKSSHRLVRTPPCPNSCPNPA